MRNSLANDFTQMTIVVAEMALEYVRENKAGAFKPILRGWASGIWRYREEKSKNQPGRGTHGGTWAWLLPQGKWIPHLSSNSKTFAALVLIEAQN